MELFEAIKGRRSIRKFLDRPIEREVLDRILQAAEWAPSGINQQQWRFYVVSGAKREKLVAYIKDSFDHIEPILSSLLPPKLLTITRQFFHTVGGAPVIILAYRAESPEERIVDIESVSAAIQNLVLAAYAEGVGSCWMTGPLQVAEKINDFMGISDLELIAAIPLGYPDPAVRPPAPPRKDGRVVFVDD